MIMPICQISTCKAELCAKFGRSWPNLYYIIDSVKKPILFLRSISYLSYLRYFGAKLKTAPSYLQVSKESESNQMNAYNLARVFCPSLMRNTADQGSTVADNFTSRDRAEIDHQTRVIELLVLHATDIFGPAELVPKDYTLRYSQVTHDEMS